LTSISHQFAELSTAFHAKSFGFETLKKKNQERRETNFKPQAPLATPSPSKHMKQWFVARN
jgi:hypothetical protein